MSEERARQNNRSQTALAPRSSWSCRPRTAPCRGSGPRGWVAGSPLEARGQRLGELLGAHPRGLSLQTSNQPQLVAGKVITVLGERALEVLPRSP